MAAYSLRAGRAELDFRARRATARAVRVGLAEIVLRKKSLTDWLKADPVAVFGRSRVTFAESTVRGHPAVEVQGRLRRLIRGLFRKQPVIRCRACTASRPTRSASPAGSGRRRTCRSSKLLRDRLSVIEIRLCEGSYKPSQS